MALTWADFANGESALSIRNKLNTFNNAVVTADSSNAAAINANAANIATNTSDIATLDTTVSGHTTSIGANTTNIATNTADIAEINSKAFSFATLYGVYGTPLTYNLTTSYQDLSNYAAQGSSGFTVSTVNGTLTPAKTGFYQVSLFLTGTTSESSEKIATVAFVEDGVVLMAGSTPYITATGVNGNFAGIFPLTAGKEYKIQIKSNVAGTVSITANNFAMHFVGE